MQYSIKDLEKLSSIKAHTIRIWERRYNIVKPERTDTNIRYYDENELKHLMNISVLVHNGIKISHIAKLTAEEVKEKAYFLLQHNLDHDNQIKNLILSMIEMNEFKFEKILGKSILNMGFEKTMIQLIYPFFQQIGILWQTGSIDPAQEHFISNLIRQKLIVSIDGLEKDKNQKENKFILYLPEGELHELGLLFYAYLIKARGFDVLYLGQSTPIHSVVSAAQIWKPSYLLFFAVSAFSKITFENYIHQLSISVKDLKIIVAGHQTEEFKTDNPENVIRISDAHEFISFLNRLE